MYSLAPTGIRFSSKYSRPLGFGVLAQYSVVDYRRGTRGRNEAAYMLCMQTEVYFHLSPVVGPPLLGKYWRRRLAPVAVVAVLGGTA